VDVQNFRLSWCLVGGISNGEGNCGAATFCGTGFCCITGDNDCLFSIFPTISKPLQVNGSSAVSYQNQFIHLHFQHFPFLLLSLGSFSVSCFPHIQNRQLRLDYVSFSFCVYKRERTIGKHKRSKTVKKMSCQWL